MQPDFDPIVLRYDGLDADGHVIDLGQLGQSIQGASKLLGSAGTIVTSGRFAKQTQALSVRVLAGPPLAHCYELCAILTTVTPAMFPMLPIIQDSAKTAATKAVTGIVNYALARMGGRKSESDAAFALAQKALEEMGHNTRTIVGAMERMAISQRPAARQFVAPIGNSCSYAQIGDSSGGAVMLDKPMRDAIDAPDPVEIGSAARFDILITELDIVNKTCKFSLQDSEDPDERVVGEITDPVVKIPNNPYSAAFNEQRWISVIGKPQVKDSIIDKVYISDLAQSLALTRT